MRWVAVGLVCAVVVGGCGVIPADPVGVASTKAGAPTAAPVKAKALSAAQAKRALLTLADMPPGWTREKPKPDDGDDDPVTPKRCAAVFDRIDQRKPLAEAKISFTAGDLGPSLEHTVTGWPSSQVPVLKQIARALKQCPKFTSRSKDGSSITIQASALSFPNLGDRTLAFRMKARSRGITIVLDAVYIAKGNNGIALVVVGLQPVRGATLVQVARAAVNRLDVTG